MIPITDIWLCVASGPSQHIADIEYARKKGVNIAACNREYETCPDATIYLASDYGFWKYYHKAIFGALSKRCEYWTSSTDAARKFRINKVEGLRDPGFSGQYGKAHLIGLSGYTLIQVVAWKKPRLIFLTGYDCQKTETLTHHFGDYPDSNPAFRGHRFNNVPHLPTRLSDGKLKLSDTDVRRGRTVSKQVDAFRVLAEQCPIKIVNCSRETALDCFERATIQEVL